VFRVGLLEVVEHLGILPSKRIICCTLLRPHKGLVPITPAIVHAGWGGPWVLETVWEWLALLVLRIACGHVGRAILGLGAHEIGLTVLAVQESATHLATAIILHVPTRIKAPRQLTLPRHRPQLTLPRHRPYCLTTATALPTINHLVRISKRVRVKVPEISVMICG